MLLDLCLTLVLQLYNYMGNTKSPELLAFEATTKSIKSGSRKYVEDAASLQRRINALRLDLIEKQKILKEWEEKLNRELQRTQMDLFK